MPEISVVSVCTAHPGQESALETTLRALVEPTRREPGVLHYDLHRDHDDPRTFVFIERWASREALDAHLQTPHLLVWEAEARPLIERETLQLLETLE